MHSNIGSFSSESRYNKLIIIAVYFSIFISSIVFFKTPFEFYASYAVMILMFPFFIGRFRVPSMFIILAMVFLAVGLFNIYIGNNSMSQFLKIFIGLFMSYLFYYYVIKAFDLNTTFLFDLYLKGAYIMALIGVVQIISFIAGFEPGYDFRWILNKSGPVLGGNLGLRLNSLYPEPSQFAIVQAPAAFIAAYDLFLRRNHYYKTRQSIIILLTYFLSFSSLGYFGVLLIVVLLFINFGMIRYLLILIPVIISLFLLIYRNVDEFSKRIDDTISVFQTNKFELGFTHGSSIILYDNYNVALENFKRNFLFGSGLGSHVHAFEKYSVTKHIRAYGFNGNSADANSMFLRILSECGIFGILISIIFIFKFYVSRKEDDPPIYWLMSNALFVLIILFFSRQGHYFINGFPFFVLLYYYNHSNYKKHLQTKHEAQITA